MRQVGDAQQEVADAALDGIGLGGQALLLLTEGSAAFLRGLGGTGVARTPQGPDLLREGVHLGAQGVAPAGDVAGLDVERQYLAELVDQLGLAAARHGGQHGIGSERS